MSDHNQSRNIHMDQPNFAILHSCIVMHGPVCQILSLTLMMHSRNGSWLLMACLVIVLFYFILCPKNNSENIGNTKFR